MDEWIAEARERRDRLFEQLSAAPEVEVTGLVDESGVSGGQIADDVLSQMTVTFEAWRVGDGALRTDQLTLRQMVEADRITPLLQQFGLENIVRVRARISEVNVFGSPQALFEEFIGRVEDLGLREHQRKLNTPVVHRDGVLGDLTWVRRFGWYEGRPRWNSRWGGLLGKRVRLHLESESPEVPQRALETARSLWADSAAWERRAKEFIAAEMLELKNGTWLKDDERPFDAERFMRRLRLDSIHVGSGDALEFWFDDGGLFWGHSIRVQANANGGFQKATIEG